MWSHPSKHDSIFPKSDCRIDKDIVVVHHVTPYLVSLFRNSALVFEIEQVECRKVFDIAPP